MNVEKEIVDVKTSIEIINEYEISMETDKKKEFKWWGLFFLANASKYFILL